MGPLRFLLDIHGPRPRGRRGAALLLVCLLLPILLLAAAFMIDVGRVTLARAQLQHAVDAAALAAASELARDGESGVVDVGVSVAGENGYAGQRLTLERSDVEIGWWDPDNDRFVPMNEAGDVAPDSVRVTAHACEERESSFGMMLVDALSLDLHATAVARKLSADVPQGFVGVDAFRSHGVLTTAAINDDGTVPLLGPREEGGHIHSNGDVELHLLGLIGVTLVRGDINAGGSIRKPAISLLTHVTGYTGPPDEPYVLPEVPEDSAERDNDNDKLSFANFNGEDFTALGIVNVGPGVYRVDDFTIVAGAIVNIEGPATFVVTGKTTVLGSVLSLNRSATDLRLLVASDEPVDLAATADLYADIYAPESHARVTAGLRYTGRLVAKEVDILATSFLYSDPTLGDPFEDVVPLRLVE